jgi:hypothetical protein
MLILPLGQWEGHATSQMGVGLNAHFVGSRRSLDPKVIDLAKALLQDGRHPLFEGISDLIDVGFVIVSDRMVEYVLHIGIWTSCGFILRSFILSLKDAANRNFKWQPDHSITHEEMKLIAWYHRTWLLHTEAEEDGDFEGFLIAQYAP